MLKSTSKIILIFLLCGFIKTINAQSFGFGCFGFVGGFAGYNNLSFEPGSLKYYGIENYKPPSVSENPLAEAYGNADGFRLGINFFRAYFSEFHITAKGFYQYIWENKNFNLNTPQGSGDIEYKLNMNAWGFGLDFGLPLTKNLNWKILDSELLFNTVKFEKTIKKFGTIELANYKNDSPEIIFGIGTGFIFKIVEDYLSLEGTAGYSFMTVKNMTDESGNKFGTTIIGLNENEFIKSGGFNAIMQLNVGFPL